MRSAVVAYSEIGEIAPAVLSVAPAAGADGEPAPDGENGPVGFAGNLRQTELPAGMIASSLNLSGCTTLQALPEGLCVRRLNVSGCPALQELPRGLRCFEIDLRGTSIRSLPE